VYIGHAYLGLENLRSIRLDVQGTQVDAPPSLSVFRPSLLRWEAWDGSSWRRMQNINLTLPDLVTGAYLFPRAAGLEPSAPQTIGGVTNCWMRSKPPVPIFGPTRAREGTLSLPDLLPTYERVDISATVGRDRWQPDAAFTNGQTLDVLRPFFPFGEKPKLGDVFYLGSQEAFGLPGASITLTLPVANPKTMSADGASVPPVKAHDIHLSWEAWNGTEWAPLGESTADEGASGSFNDHTLAFTTADDPRVELQLPTVEEGSLKQTTINGITNYWIRVRIASGNYGLDAHFIGQPPNQTFVAADFAPPQIASANLAYEAEVPPLPADLVTFNNLQFDNIGAQLAQGQPAMPFRALPDLPPSLYLAFTVPPVRGSFPNRPVTLYHGLISPLFGKPAIPLHPRVSVQHATPGATVQEVVHRFTLANTHTDSVSYRLDALGGVWERSVSKNEATLAPGESIDLTVTVRVPAAADIPAGTVNDIGFMLAGTEQSVFSAIFETRIGPVTARRRSVRWEYWNGASWVRLLVLDSTNELTQSGLVEFLGPGDIAQASYFGVTGYWLRVLFETGDDGEVPLLRTLLPNTTLAAQTVTVLNETLGSSDATAGQLFRVARAPVLAAQRLEVREPAPLTQVELDALRAAHGESGVTPVDNANVNEVWVRWIEAPDFYASGAQDRHYVLDAVAGEIRFGDGVQGRIPPRGAGNVRMARYQTGGGSAGNVAVGAIVQMKTTVPFIDKVLNREAAAGGSSAETNADVRVRAPRTLRHGGRAVTGEDYEDLARLASPEVARAKTVPLRLLLSDPLGAKTVAGALSIVILPRSSDFKPLPSAQLLARVQEFLLARQAVNADVDVVGPLYVRVDVTLEVALVRLDGASQVEQAIRARLAAFLHPLTGGRDGTGWDFGRQPHISDLQAVVAGPGVDHVRKLAVAQVEDVPGAAGTGRFLIYSGQHQITLTLAGAQ
jgi:hypothetical protein